MNDDLTKIIAEYSEDYCRFLEAAYGVHMMSEGGTKAIDRMLEPFNIRHKKVLDIGFGLGGLAFHLAEHHQAEVFGIEINPWMVGEAKRRTPETLSHLVHFQPYHPDKSLPFSDQSIDLVLSKGVLTHLSDKTTLFQQINRVLKDDGVLIIDDWLSPHQGRWGDRINVMCEAEDLTLYAETEQNYQKLLHDAHFTEIEIQDENHNYAQYNQDVIQRLKQYSQIDTNTPWQNCGFTLKEAIESYQLIIDAIMDNELLIRRFRAKKK